MLRPIAGNRRLSKHLSSAIQHFAHIGQSMAALVATAEVTGEVLGKPNPKMQLVDDSPSLYKPWRVFRELKSAAAK